MKNHELYKTGTRETGPLVQLISTEISDYPVLGVFAFAPLSFARLATIGRKKESPLHSRAASRFPDSLGIGDETTRKRTERPVLLSAE